MPISMNEEPGPAEHSFGQGGEGVAGQMLGSKGLSSAVGMFDQNITKLQSAIERMASWIDSQEDQRGQVGQAGVLGNTQTHFPSQSQAAQSAYQQLGGQAPPSEPPDDSSSGQSVPQPMSGPSSGGAGGSGYGSPPPGTPPPKPPGGGTGTPSLGGVLGGTAAMVAAFGKMQQGGQTAMNTVMFQGALMGANPQAIRASFGTGSPSSNSGTGLAFSAQDAAGMYAVQQQIAGAGLVSSTPAGRAGMGATAAFGYSSPAMTGTQAAQAAQTEYMPQTSLAMRMMGYPTTPREMGQAGGVNSSAKVDYGMLDYLGLSKYSEKHVAGALQPGSMGYADLQQIPGGTSMIPQLEMYDKLMNGGESAQQAQQLVTAAGGRGPEANAAQAELTKKFGIPASNLEALKKKGGQQTADTADLQNSFATALQDTNKAMASATGKGMGILDKIPGGRAAAGFGLGAGAGVLGGKGGSIISKVGGVAKKGFEAVTNVIGGGAAPNGGAGSSSPSTTTSSKTTTTTGGKASGAAVAAYAKTFATGLDHPYVSDGSSPTSGWDCVGFACYVYNHFGYTIPNFSPGVNHPFGCAGIWPTNSGLQKASAQSAGVMILEAGSDSPGPGQPGHVGISAGGPGSQMYAAADQAEGTIPETPQTGSDLMGYMEPKGGFGGGSGGSSSSSTTTAGSLLASGMSAGLGTGDTAAMGSTSELQNVGSAVTGGISAGSGYQGEKPPVTTTNGTSNTAGSGGSGSSASGYTSGSDAQNLISIGKYLMANGFDRYGAAGVAGTIAGESGGNPESVNCVPLTYQVVTTRGILFHDEVRVGDHTMVYSPETGRVEEAEVLDVPYHFDAEIFRIGNDHWSVICTGDHKWITSDGKLVRADELKMGEAELMLGEDWYETVEYWICLGREDTFCLTTTTGTWTTYTDDGDATWTGNSGGNGLIGWTPPKAGIVTGNATKDFQTQLPLIIAYANANSGEAVARGGQTLADLKAATSLQQALTDWSAFEGPANPGSDERLSEAQTVYNALAEGGQVDASASSNWNSSICGLGKGCVGGPGGSPYGSSPRTKKPGDKSGLLGSKTEDQPLVKLSEGGNVGGAITRSPQAPFTISATQRIQPSPLSPLYGSGGNTGTVNVTLPRNSVNISLTGGATISEGQANSIAQSIVTAIQKQMSQVTNVGGVT